MTCQNECCRVPDNCGCQCNCGCSQDCCPPPPEPRRGHPCRRYREQIQDAREKATAEQVACVSPAACPTAGCCCENDPDVPSCGCGCDGGAPDRGNLRVCCDQNGCCHLYPRRWRNPFWPEFSHPRWLCCKDLYNVRD